MSIYARTSGTQQGGIGERASRPGVGRRLAGRRGRLVLLALLSIALVVALSTVALATNSSFVTTQLTMDDFDQWDPQVSGDRVVWAGYGGTDAGDDSEIFTWKVGDASPTQITANDYNDASPQVSGDRVVWIGDGGGDSGEDNEVFTWKPDGNGIIQLTMNSLDEYGACVSGDRVVWCGTGGAEPSADYEIWMWKAGDNPSQITANSVNEDEPRVSGDRLVWTGPGGTDAGNDPEVFTWSWGDISVTQLTANETTDQSPQVSGDRVVWAGYDGVGSDQEIFTWKLGDLAPTQVTINYDNDESPQVSGERLVWHGRGGSDAGRDYEIFTWKAGDVTPTQVTTGDYNDGDPQISGDRVVWEGSGGDTSEVLAWKVGDTSPAQLTNNQTDDQNPQVSGDRVVWSGYGGTDAGSDAEIFTAVAATQATPTRYQETDGRLSYAPAWNGVTYWAYSGGSEKYTHVRGGSVTIPFEGTRLDWIAKTSHVQGYAAVSVDGGPATYVDLYSPTTLYKQKVYSTGELKSGLHTVRISMTGYKNPKSGGAAITIDAVDVVGKLVWSTRYQDNDVSVHYTRGWWSVWSWSYSGGGMRTCNNPPAVAYSQAGAPDGVADYLAVPRGSVTLRFDGVRLNVIATKARGYGKAWISVDGKPRVLVDLYSYTTKYKQTVYSTGFLAPGMHTVIISWSGYKNVYSKGTAINVDAFDIIGVLGGDT
jgi:hypothetical protein